MTHCFTIKTLAASWKPCQVAPNPAGLIHDRVGYCWPFQALLITDDVASVPYYPLNFYHNNKHMPQNAWDTERVTQNAWDHTFFKTEKMGSVDLEGRTRRLHMP